jgi:hypothetical protein
MVRVLKLKNKSKITGKFRISTYEAGTDNLIWQSDWQENLISNADTHGHNIIIRHLYGDVTYPLEITRARFGTVNTSPTSADTDIASPLAYDIEIASRSIVSATEVSILFFAPNVYIPDDTYYTFGCYAGSKIFGMHLLDTPFEKTGSVDTTIEYVYSIDNIA